MRLPAQSHGSREFGHFGFHRPCLYLCTGRLSRRLCMPTSCAPTQASSNFSHFSTHASRKRGGVMRAMFIGTLGARSIYVAFAGAVTAPCGPHLEMPAPRQQPFAAPSALGVCVCCSHSAKTCARVVAARICNADRPKTTPSRVGAGPGVRFASSRALVPLMASLSDTLPIVSPGRSSLCTATRTESALTRAHTLRVGPRAHAPAGLPRRCLREVLREDEHATRLRADGAGWYEPLATLAGAPICPAPRSPQPRLER